MKRRYAIAVGGREFTIDVDELSANRFAVSVDGDDFDVELTAADDVPGNARPPQLEPAPGRTEIPPAPAGGPAGVPHIRLQPSATPARPRPPAGPGTATSGMIRAPIPGVILGVLVELGATVGRGDPIAVLEAMKMRNTIRAPRAGQVVEVCVADGQPVGLGEPLVRLGPAPE